VGSGLTAKKIAHYLSAEMIGEDRIVQNVMSLDNAAPGVLTFINNPVYDEKPVGAVYIISCYKKKYDMNANTYIISKNPRLDFAKVVKNFFYKEKSPGIAHTAVIDPGAMIGENCYIGHHCYIGENVTIGSNTMIHANVTILGDTSIGDNCRVCSGVRIGEDGLGCIKDENNNLFDFPHLGGVLIGDHVVIGPNSAIQKGTMNLTTIGSYTKLSQLVSIGHNSLIGTNVQIAGMAHLSGSVVVENNCFLGANCSIKNGIVIGSNTTIGIGAVVEESVGKSRIVQAPASRLLDIFQ